MFADRMLELFSVLLTFLSLLALALMTLATLYSMIKLDKFYFWLAVGSAFCFYVFQLINIHIGGYFGV
jgi:hypothetical protein